MKWNVTLFVGVLAIAYSCVPARQFQDEKNRRQNCEKQLTDLQKSYDNLNDKYNDLTDKYQLLEKQHNKLKQDTQMTNHTLRTLQIQYDKINELYQLLLDKNRELLAGNRAETERISTELMSTQERLQKKEDQLRKLESELNMRSAELNEMARKLSEKEKRVNELENLLAEQQRSVQNLRKKVADALIGFENNGLTITIRDGKVYVSLDESLLFASGSWAVNARGRDALIRLAKVLEANPDINILVEGHTDNVPLRSSGQVKDNWDLSVMRATAIAKILIENSRINPKRITAAGRSEYDPIENNDTPQGRARNRRTEIILIPKLDQLYQLIQQK